MEVESLNSTDYKQNADGYGLFTLPASREQTTYDKINHQRTGWDVCSKTSTIKSLSLQGDKQCISQRWSIGL